MRRDPTTCRAVGCALALGWPALACSDGDPLSVLLPEGPRPRASTRVFSGRAAMLFDGPACTREPGAKGDRYCAFVSRVGDAARSLYVFNVSAVLAGTPVSCDAPDPNCLLLTASLGGDLFDPTQHGTQFQGDTLVYYDAELTPYAWRPGMERGRVLVEGSPDSDATFCHPATSGSAVACLVLPAEQEDPLLAQARIHAGSADGVTEPLLAPLAPVIAANLRDRVPRFGYLFPDSEPGRIAWTTRDDATGPEKLRLAAVDDPSSTVVVASDVHDPAVSPDGARWLWLAGADATGVGTLQSARFPGGDDATELLASVREFGASPARGTVVARTSMAELVAVPIGSSGPGQPLTLDTKVQALVAMTDTEHVAYAKHFVGTTQVDLFVAEVDGSATCVIDTAVKVHRNSLYFSPGSESAVWAFARGGGAFDGHHTHLASCTTTPLAPDIVALGWLGRDTVFMMDSFDPDALTGALRYRSVTRGSRLGAAPASLIAEHVDTYAISDPDRSTLVYTVNGSVESDGVYVW